VAGLAGVAFAAAAAAQTVITNDSTLSGIENGNFSAASGVSFYSQGAVFTGGTTTITNGYVYLNNPLLNSLTIVSSAAFTGDATMYATVSSTTFINDGTFTNTAGTNYIYGGGQTGFVFTNAGTVSATNGSLYVGSGSNDTVVNTGMIQANGGVNNAYVTVGNAGGSVANTGFLEAIGSTSTLTLGTGTATWTNLLGNIEALSGGTVNLGGAFFTSNLTQGNIYGAGGTVNITGSLNNAAATLEAPNQGGIFTLNGGTISGGTVDNTGTPALTFGTAGGSTLNNVSMTGNFTVPLSASFNVQNGTTFSSGTTTFTDSYVYVNGAGATALTIAPGATWTGDVTIYATAANMSVVNNGTFTNTSSTNYIYGGGQSGFTFTNTGTVNSTNGSLYVGSGSNDAVTNSGTIEANGGANNAYVTVGNASGNVTNTGTLEAIGPTSELTLGTGTATWSNAVGMTKGTITALGGGTVNLGGSFSTANLTQGYINATGGTVNMTGNLDNTSGGPLEAPDQGGVFTLNGGTITGGAVDSTGSPALTFGPAGGSTLNGVSMVGNFTVPSGASFTAENGTTFSTGTTTFGDGYVYLRGAGTALTLSSGAMWLGNVEVYATVPNLSFVNNGVFTNSAGGNYIYGGGNIGFMFTNTGTVDASGGSLTIGNGGTDTVTNSVGGVISAGTGASITLGNGPSVTVTNNGTVTATGANTSVTLGSGNSTWTNNGTINATNGGTVNFGGSFPTSDLSGTINGLGGTLNITGTVNNLSSILGAPTTGIFTLAGGTISKGTVSGNALTFGNSGGTLDGVNMSGSFNFPVASYGSFTAINNTTFSGSTTTFTTPGYDSVSLNGTGTSLTIAPGAIWTGSFSVYGQAPNLTFANQGTINFTAGSNNIYGNNSGFTFTNTGTVNVTSGSAILGYYLNDTVTNGVGGTMTSSGSGTTLYFGYSQASWSNMGSLLATNNGAINFGGNYSTTDLGGTIDANTGGVLNLGGNLTNTGATLNPPHTGVYTLAGATILQGTVASGALTFSSNGGTLDGVAMNGSFNLPAAAYASFTAKNNTTFTGGTTTFSSAGYDTVDLNGTGTALTIAPGAIWTGNFDMYSQAANLTFANQGTLNFAAGSSNIHGNSTGFTFTNTGSVTVNAGASLTLGYYSNDTITNAAGATMTATGANSYIYLGYNQAAWSNLGTLLATSGGTIGFDGNYTTADLGGVINATAGGVLNLGGNLTNTGATLNPPNTGVYTLAGATILQGTVASGALTFSSSGGTLDGVTMNGSFNFPAAAYASFTAKNNTTFTGGTTTFASGGYDTVYLGGTGTALTVAPGSTWTGGFNIYSQAANLTLENQGSLDLTGGSSSFYGNSLGFTLSNTGAINVTGAGSLYLGYYTSDTITNGPAGVITANGGSVYLGYNQSAWSNSGTLQAINSGTIYFESNYTTADLGGTIMANTGGALDLEGVLNNTAATLNPPNSGEYTLYGATITGGTVASGALTFSSNGGILDGVTMNGSFSLPPSQYASFDVRNNATFTGGTTAFTAPGYDTVYLDSTGTTLTIAPTATWTGSFNMYGQVANTSVLNQGAIDLGTGGNSIYGNSNGFSFLNSGSLDEIGGTLYLGYYANDSFTNQAGGTLEANGGTVYLDYNLATDTNLSSHTLTGGTWRADANGTIAFQETTNSIVTNDATVILNGTGSTIETRSGAGPTYQTIEQTLATNNGTLEVIGGRNFASTSAGMTNNGTIQLGGGTFTAASLSNGPGSTLSGFGTFSPTGGTVVGSNVLVSPGSASPNAYVAALSFGTPLTLAAGGSGAFDIENASGAAGVGYDTINVAGTLTITASSGSPFTINLESINPGTGTPGLATFNSAQSYQWTLLSATSISGFSASNFFLNTSAFANSLGVGTFFISANANDVFLNFTPVPEPSTWALTGLGIAALGLAWLGRRSRRWLQSARAQE
jgi:hypothetical protein